jgi:hypothetical protein
MATIKRKPNGKIITKNGKVSCTCCACVSGFTKREYPYTNNDRVFWEQISKDQYDAILNGGNFTLNVSGSQSESATVSNQPATSNGTMSGNVSFIKNSGCRLQAATGLFGVATYTASWLGTTLTQTPPAKIFYRISFYLENIKNQNITEYFLFYYIEIIGQTFEGLFFFQTIFIPSQDEEFYEPITTSNISFNIAGLPTITLKTFATGSSNPFGWTFAKQNNYAYSIQTSGTITFTPL